MKQKTTEVYYTRIQMKIPLDLQTIIEISDPVYTFNEVMEHIDLNKYFVTEGSKMGRPRYDSVTLLKVVLFAFMENGYASLRNIEKLCKTDVRYIWLLDGLRAPSYVTVSNFLNEYLKDKLEDVFRDINGYIFAKEDVDLRHTYIDGTKIEANANKYKWVWKKACTTSRERLYLKISALLDQINNETLCMFGVKFGKREEYTVEYMESLVSNFVNLTQLNISTIPNGRGHHKSTEQREYCLLYAYTEKLKEYAKHIEICGEHRNSYAKTDRGATFMRVKSDYMGNDQLLPAYNMQIAVCDEYIAAVDVEQFASDTDCFVPLMEKYKDINGCYPKYPVTDAGYGSYNNYLYCEEHGINKYMKYPMFNKDTTDPKYRENAYRVENFGHDEEGHLVCPNGKRFFHICDRQVRGNRYGRTEEIHECEDCTGCPYRGQCHKSQHNRRVSLNRELSEFHREVCDNLECIKGALLRMNRSIQAEGAFGIIKWDRSYKRACRRGIKAVFLEFTLLACGFNLYKYHNKKIARLNQQPA